MRLSLLDLSRILAAAVCVLPATSVLDVQFILLAGILLSMTMIPGVCLRGMNDSQVLALAIPHDIIKWMCSVLLLGTSGVSFVSTPTSPIHVGLALLAICGMMRHDGRARIAMGLLVGVVAAVGYSQFGLPLAHGRILLLSGAVFVSMTVMWRRKEKVAQSLR